MQGEQLVVQGDDLGPVGLPPRPGPRVHRRDGRLQLVRPRRAHGGRPIQHLHPVRDRSRVPQRAVLLREEHDLARRVEARARARQVEPHQHDEAQDFGLLGQKPRDQARQPHRVLRDVAPRRHLCPAAQVTLVEHQVEHRQDGVDPRHQLGALRHPVGDVGFHDLAFGADDPLGHRRLGDQERRGDLLGGEARDRAQGQRDLRLLGQRRVAAREDQAKAVIGLRRVRRCHGPLQKRELLRVSLVAAQQVDGAAARRRHQPCAGVVRDALRRPFLERRHQAVLDNLLRDVEVADETHHRARELGGLFAEDCRECRIGDVPCLGQALIVPQPARPRQGRRAMPWPSRAPRRDPSPPRWRSLR